MQLTISQNKAVNKLIDAFNNRGEHKLASFKAPTGSGKTFMASEFISRVFAKEMGKDKKTIFVVATISNAKLPRQFAKKLENYRGFHEFNDYKIEHIESPSTAKSNKAEDVKEFYLEDNKIFVFGTSSFGKNTLFYQNHILESFLQQAKELNYQIFFIRDEAHIGKKESISKGDLKNFDQKMRESSDFVIDMTATPKSRINLVEMTSEDMEGDGFNLLKIKMEKTKLSSEVSNGEIIDDAISTFLKSKKEYQSLNDVIINPAMLIQVMNDSDHVKSPEKHRLFEEGLDLLERKLKASGMRYLKYINNSPEVINTSVPNTLEYASKIDSEIDAIIFKVGPATGWDIPRANMLLQLRNVSSDSLNMQTVGRIMRNPYPNLKKNDSNSITNKYYIWSNYQKPTREEAVYKLKEKFRDETFVSGRIDLNSRKIVEDNNNYVNDVLEFLDSPDFLNTIKDIIPVNDIIYDQANYGDAFVKNKIPNHIYLKIYNEKLRNELENVYKLSLFDEKLLSLSMKYNININVVWYVFLNSLEKLSELKHKNSKWISDPEPYTLKDAVRTLSYYTIWRKIEDPKFVSTKDFLNYGYIQVTGDDENIQHLDSEPEKKFYEKFRDATTKTQKLSTKFFAKMPTLGSQVYFDYYSKIQGKITKSFMDFVIKHEDKIVLVEVKSRNEDYSKEKTAELLKAYEIYMNKFKGKNFSLILYQYDKYSDTNYVTGYIDGKWQKDLSFGDLIEHIYQ